MYNYYSVLYGRPADSRHGCCRLMVFSRNELGQEERRRSFRKRARLLISRPPNFTILAHYRDTPTTFPGRGRFAAFGRQENDRQDRNTRDDKHATPKYFHRPVVKSLCRRRRRRPRRTRHLAVGLHVSKRKTACRSTTLLPFYRPRTATTGSSFRNHARPCVLGRHVVSVARPGSSSALLLVSSSSSSSFFTQTVYSKISRAVRIGVFFHDETINFSRNTYTYIYTRGVYERRRSTVVVVRVLPDKRFTGARRARDKSLIHNAVLGGRFLSNGRVSKTSRGEKRKTDACYAEQRYRARILSLRPVKSYCGTVYDS